MIMPDWRICIVDHLNCNDYTDVYGFGVFSGVSMVEIAICFAMMERPIRKFFGFDSFICLQNVCRDVMGKA